MRAALSLAATFAALTVAAAAQTSPAAVPACVRALVAMDDGVDSARSKAGDAFRFRLVDAATEPDGTVIPSGTLGYGIVANAAHAEKGGRGGYLALETRFLVSADGRHVPAIIDRATGQAAAAVGASGNAPGLLGMIPIVGYAVGGYDSLHHGRDATIVRGTRIGVFIGDDAALGTCRPLPVGESPSPAASPLPSATPRAE